MRKSGLLDRVLQRLQSRLNDAGLSAPEPPCDAAPACKDRPGRLLAATDQGDPGPTEKITTPEPEGDLMTSLQAVRDRFARDQGLPFAESLSAPSILDALNEHGVQFRDRLFSPVTPLGGFLS